MKNTALIFNNYSIRMGIQVLKKHDYIILLYFFSELRVVLIMELSTTWKGIHKLRTPRF